MYAQLLLSVYAQIWEQWSELQQVLALYSLLRSSSTHATSAHLMMANMLYAHHSSEYMHHLFQQANDPGECYWIDPLTYPRHFMLLMFYPATRFQSYLYMQ